MIDLSFVLFVHRRGFLNLIAAGTNALTVIETVEKYEFNLADK